MPGNTAARDAATMRREIVARLRVRGLSEREIADALEKQGVLSVKTGKPVSHVQIHRDMIAIRKAWAAGATEAEGERVARLLAELAEIKRAAASAGDLGEWGRSWSREVKLFGLDAPTETRNLNVDLSQLTDEQIDRLAKGEDLIHVLITTGAGSARETPPRPDPPTE